MRGMVPGEKILKKSYQKLRKKPPECGGRLGNLEEGLLG